MDRDYSYFEDKNSSEEEGMQPMVVIQIFSDGSLSTAGRDDMTMREVAALLHMMSHDMMETLEAREKKAMEN